MFTHKVIEKFLFSHKQVEWNNNDMHIRKISFRLHYDTSVILLCRMFKKNRNKTNNTNALMLLLTVSSTC